MKAGAKSSEFQLAAVILAVITAFQALSEAGITKTSTVFEIVVGALGAVYIGARTYLKGKENGKEMDPEGH